MIQLPDGSYVNPSQVVYVAAEDSEERVVGGTDPPVLVLDTGAGRVKKFVGDYETACRIRDEIAEATLR